MKLIVVVLLCCLSAFGTTTSLVVDAHPSGVAQFVNKFRCPHANVWLVDGPEKAAKDMGILEMGHRLHRHLQPRENEQFGVAGSCVLVPPFTGQSTCLEMRGAWSDDAMEARCSSVDGVLSHGSQCEVSTTLAGWCIVNVKDNVVEATPFPLATSTDCDEAKRTCESFLSGSFDGVDECGSSADQGETGACELAPGPIGAAHQLGASSGYTTHCPGTPAEGSPYMWPLKWQAYTSSEALLYNSDEIIYQSRGKVFYRLDKNWKRQDWYMEEGLQRGPGRGLCPEELQVPATNESIPYCSRNVTHRQTMLHRGEKMIFINWKEGIDDTKDDVGDVVNCTQISLGVIGNVRPDWFLDKRGAATDVQYLGNQHLYHENIPRLVKQWRKQDFVKQYFTMSMQENLGPDGVHWPLILNVPGEGLGEDLTISYKNHSLLTDDDDDLFLLDRALEAAGVSCPSVPFEGLGLTPINEIPSNLDVDPNAWFSSEYTFSPFWEPPPRTEDGCSTSDRDNETEDTAKNMATVEEGAVKVNSCYDSSLGAVRMEFDFTVSGDEEAELPWVAIGYRESDRCLMNPPSGAALPIILLGVDPLTDSLSAAKGYLPSVARSGSGAAVMSVYTSLTDLQETEEYSNVVVSSDEATGAVSIERQVSDLHQGGVAGTVLKLKFTQTVAKAPVEPMFLTYAIGASPQLGYHSDRRCFTVTEFPECTSTSSDPEDDMQENVSSGSWNPAISRVLMMFLGIFVAL